MWKVLRRVVKGVVGFSFAFILVNWTFSLVPSWLTLSLGGAVILLIMCLYISSRIADRRGIRLAAEGRCAYCGYLLRGLTRNTCPECGTAFYAGCGLSEAARFRRDRTPHA